MFISYAHESEEQRRRVRSLAEELREGGVDAVIDQFVEDDPPYWPTWMQDQLEQADFVLCVVSPMYRERFESRERISPGRGVNWEALVVTEASYADLPAAHRKFIAIAFDDEDLKAIPRVLLAAGRTAYVLPGYYHQLYRRITGQAQAVPALGEVKVLSDAPAAILDIHSRPPFVPARFLDREGETGLLHEAVQRSDRPCVLLTGRAGIGKTALVGRLLQFLESQPRERPLTFAYVSGTGSVPISPDLIRTHLRPTSSASGSAQGNTILVVDQAEALLDDEGAWTSEPVGLLLAELAVRESFQLIVVSRRAPCAPVLAELRPSRVTLRDGLPPDDARRLLLDADADGRLGLRDAPAALDLLLRQAGGNPRALELIISALAADPMLEPERFAKNLAADPDFAAGLLGDSYQTLDEPEREIVSLLSVARGTLPIEVIGAAFSAPDALNDHLRDLVGHEIVRYDRATRRVRLDPFDAQYVAHHLVAPEDTADLHSRVAVATTTAIHAQRLAGSEADMWAIAAVEHFLAAGEIAKATAALDRFQACFLESHGIYDQVVRLRKRLMEEAAEPPTNRVSLLRLLSLQGDFRSARELIESTDVAIRAIGDPQLVAAWDTEVGVVQRDSGDRETAMACLSRAFADHVTPRTRARALSAAAQIARRRGDLEQSESWLRKALEQLSGLQGHQFLDRQTEALTLHQLAMAARFQRRQAEALSLLTRSIAVSQAAEDRGGLAYRQSFRAALDSDNFALDDAKAALQLALATYDEIGDEWGAAAATAALASIEADRGCYDRALTHADDAAALARNTDNMRVLGLLSGVRLHVERRTGNERAESRSLVVRAKRALASRGFELYAQRLEIDLLLHDLAVGAISAEAAVAALPGELRWTERAGAQGGATDTVLLLARPLAVFAPLVGLPAGIAADVALVAERS